MEGGVAGKSKATLKRTTITGNHASRDFLHKLNELRWSKTLVDVVLVGEESRLEIPAHKLLLAACSPYFNSRFVQLMPQKTLQQFYPRSAYMFILKARMLRQKIMFLICVTKNVCRFSSAWEGKGDCRDSEGRERVQVFLLNIYLLLQ